MVDPVLPSGEVVGVEISPETAINARRRIEKNRWSNVQVIVADARTVKVEGRFDGLLAFAAADVYASPQALDNLFPYLRNDAHVVAFGAKLSHRRLGNVLNPLLRPLWNLSFSSTPALNYKPWTLLESRVGELHVQDHFFGSMFLACGLLVTSENLAVSVNGASSGRLTLTVDNGDNPPLVLTEVQPLSLERRAYFDPQGKASLKLYYGDEKLSAPVYDYARFFRLDESAAQAQLGLGAHNDAYTGRPDARPWTERHQAVLWVAMLVAVSVLGAIAIRGLKRAT